MSDASTIIGPATLTGNTAGVEFNRNTVVGPLRITGNAGRTDHDSAVTVGIGRSQGRGGTRYPDPAKRTPENALWWDGDIALMAQVHLGPAVVRVPPARIELAHAV